MQLARRASCSATCRIFFLLGVVLCVPTVHNGYMEFDGAHTTSTKGAHTMTGTTVISWYDSDDPTNRRRNLSLWLSSPEGKRGTLYECERENPSDVWPVATMLGEGYSVASAEKMAKRRGLVRVAVTDGRWSA